MLARILVLRISVFNILDNGSVTVEAGFVWVFQYVFNTLDNGSVTVEAGFVWAFQ